MHYEQFKAHIVTLLREALANEDLVEDLRSHSDSLDAEQDALWLQYRGRPDEKRLRRSVKAALAVNSSGPNRAAVFLDTAATRYADGK